MIFIYKCKGVLWVTILGVMLFLAPSVKGGELFPGDNAVNSLGHFHTSGKIGGPNDESKFARSVWKYFEVKDTEKLHEADIAAQAYNALKLIKIKAFEIYEDAETGSAEDKIAMLLRQLTESQNSITPVGLLNVLQKEKIGAWKINSDNLQWTPNIETTVDFAKDFLDGKCVSPSSQECITAFGKAVEALRLAELTYRSVALCKAVKINEAYVFFKKRVKQREEYRDGFAQWPWEELFVNGPIYREKTKNVPGSPPPPTSQLIVLHPDIVMEYMPDAKDGDQFKPAFMVELIGINSWEWEKDGNMGGPFFGLPIGASLVTTFSDREDQSDWGWGGIVHINHIFNFGLSFRDSDPGYFVSVNLAELFNMKDTVENVLGK